MRKPRLIVSTAIFLAIPAIAQAHVSIPSSSAFADVTGVVVFGVSHGCEADGANLDTTAVTIQIPAGVTSVRPELGAFDDVQLETDKTGAVVAVTWTKDRALDSDIAYYELRLKLKAPDAPFSTLLFPTHQTCTSADGETEQVVDWVGEAGDAEVEPAPVLHILPARFPGWNKFTVDDDIKDLAAFFADAEIVWAGSAAYSINPATVDLIAETEGVSSLSKIEAGTEIWVKY